MSLTSYRAAPPRVGLGSFFGVCFGGLEDLAAADFSAAWAAVSWALEVFTVEFGMGSGVVPPPKPPGRPNHGSVAASGSASGQECVVCGRCSKLVSGAWGPLGPDWMSAVQGLRRSSDDWRRTAGAGIEPFGRLGPVRCGVAACIRPAYRRAGLARPSGRPGFEGGFPLRCFQRLSSPHIATRRCRWRDNRYTRGASIPVLSY